MRRAVAALLVLGVMSSCTYRQSRKTALAGGVMTVAGIGLIALGIGLDRPGAGNTPLGVALVGAYWFTIPGAGIGALGLLGMALHHGDLDRERAAAREVARDRALDLTKRASAAARAGNCTDVVERDREIGELDPELRATVFVRDEVIRQCLDAENARVERERDTCRARRSQALRAAQSVPDAGKRQAMLGAAPRCGGE